MDVFLPLDIRAAAASNINVRLRKIKLAYSEEQHNAPLHPILAINASIQLHKLYTSHIINILSCV